MGIKSNTILAACLGQCIHVNGVHNFLQLAEQWGYQTEFLSPPVPVLQFIDLIERNQPEIVAVSYRLTPAIGKDVLIKFIEMVKERKLEHRRFFLGCLPELAKYAQTTGFFEAIFVGGESIEEVLPALRITVSNEKKEEYPQSLVVRRNQKAPFPLIRAHFGLPELETTINGMEKLAQAKILDVISIAPDQAAQEGLHHPEWLATAPKGAGGVPIRDSIDLQRLYDKSRCGNFPLLRIYSGTRDLILNAQLFQETIHNAWAAIPLFWYSRLDGRGPEELEDALKEHMDTIRWHAIRDIPVEINDPHQWGLRAAPDHLVVADAYLSARAAKELGVKVYIEQIMFNTPTGVSLKMDLARAIAMAEITKPLIDNNFIILRETRAGLAYLAPDPTVAKGQLVLSTTMQLAIKPDIIHVVSYCEADHAATPEEIIESCRLLRRVMQDSLIGLPDLASDPEIIARKEILIEEAKKLLHALEQIGETRGIVNPYSSPQVLTEIVRRGLWDAPQLKGSPIAKGEMRTKIIKGACVIVDSMGNPLLENERNILFLATKKGIHESS